MDKKIVNVALTYNVKEAGDTRRTDTERYGKNFFIPRN